MKHKTQKPWWYESADEALEKQQLSSFASGKENGVAVLEDSAVVPRS